MSPYLFNIFINDLVEQLNGSGLSPLDCLFYVDDGVLLAKTYDHMRQLLDTVVDQYNINGLYLNIAKCGQISADGDVRRLYVNGEIIPLVTKYDYLGFPISSARVDFTSHLD